MDRQQVKSEPGTGPSDTPSATSATASPLPTSANYTDFILRSTAPSSASGWKHNVMKFAVSGERVVDPADESLFMRPVKLNRKDPRTVRRLTDEDRERHNRRALERAARAAGDAGMDVDVKPGEGGVKAEDQEDGAGEDKEELDPELVGKGANGTTGMQRRGPSGQFKKKTKRVYVSSEEARRLRREEWQPWVLEDDEGHERWIGRLEGGAGDVETAKPSSSQSDSKNGAGLAGWRPAAEASATGGGGSAYVAFVLSEDGEYFEVVPVNRWYRFNQGPKYMTLAEEEAEQEYNRQQKSRETERWMMHRRAAPASTTSGSATPQPSASTSGASNGTAVSASALRARMMARSATGTRADAADVDERGRPRVRTVISAGGGEGGRGGGGGGGGGRAQDQDADEFDYEEDFQDDEEGIAQIDDLADEDERKELEERIRREMRAVERMEDTPEAEDDDEAAAKRLTGTGKEIKKLVKKSDKSGAYESDDEDENPYASDVDDSDDNASTTSATRDAGSRAASPNPLASPSSAAARSRSRGTSHSRAGSPSAAGYGSGSALVAKRATSPAPGSASGGKRKRSAHSADGAASDSDVGDGSKRRKAHGGKSPSPAPAPVGLLTQADLVAYLKTKPNQTTTTKEVLTHFRKAIKGDARNKANIGGLLQAVANLVGGNLVLKQGL